MATFDLLLQPPWITEMPLLAAQNILKLWNRSLNVLLIKLILRSCSSAVTDLLPYWCQRQVLLEGKATGPAAPLAVTHLSVQGEWGGGRGQGRRSRGQPQSLRGGPSLWSVCPGAVQCWLQGCSTALTPARWGQFSSTEHWLSHSFKQYNMASDFLLHYCPRSYQLQ